MLPRRHRLTSSREFARVVRSGDRFKAGHVVGHLGKGDGDTRIGLIVSKRVGNSVQRHRVSRILRHAAAARVGQLPPGSMLVLRALPGAAAAQHSLATDVDRIVDRAARS